MVTSERPGRVLYGPGASVKCRFEMQTFRDAHQKRTHGEGREHIRLDPDPGVRARTTLRTSRLTSRSVRSRSSPAFQAPVRSSLVFGTIAAESQRLINETYPAFVQQFMPRYGQPDADQLDNISAAIIVDQQRLGGNSRSTVATVTDAAQMLRVLYSRAAEPRLPSPGLLFLQRSARHVCNLRRHWPGRRHEHGRRDGHGQVAQRGRAAAQVLRGR